MTPRIVLIGAVESTAVALRTIASSPADLALCVTLPPEHAARHSDYVDLESAASEVGARLFHCSQVNHADTLAAIREAGADFIFIIGWSQICGPAFLEMGEGRIIGYHPAPLPRLRGRAAIAWTILLDEKISAGSLFWLTGGVDDGPLLDQHYFHVAPRETAASLYAKHMQALEAMLGRCLARLAQGERPMIEQDERCATFAVRRTPADGRIDWQRPAHEVDRLVRAAGRPYPGAFTTAKGKKLTIWAAEPAPTNLPFHAQPGQLLALEDTQLLVQTGDGQIRLTDWSWEGEGRLSPHSLLGAAA